MEKELFWADKIADEIIKREEKELYVCASGITPSGTIHIGNFREVITVDIVVKALRDKGKKVRFIYSWDDFDRFRKVPVNIPKKEEIKNFIGFPVNKVPDPFGCHRSYAEHFEKEFEESIKNLGISPEFLRQGELYPSCIYSEEIKTALLNREKIRKILNKYRKEELPENWFPIRIYCENCGYDSTKVEDYNNGYRITYSCRCGFSNTIDFRKKGIVKLVWRVDWPMRWYYEKVDFEPGGKEHSTPGGSRTTAVEISKEVYNYEPPVYKMYDFIIVKGIGGKMSSSAGNVIKVDDALQIYLPEIIRFLFARTKPRKEFAIGFDEEVFKTYEDFYFTERVYFGREEIPEKKKEHLKRVYRFSIPFEIPGKLPVQPSFRLASTLVQILDEKKTVESLIKKYSAASEFDINRIETVVKKAKNWIEKYAPEPYKINLSEKPQTEFLAEKQKQALRLLSNALKNELSEEELYNKFYEISSKLDLKPKEFFSTVYRLLLGRPFGPRLASLILAIGKDRVRKRIEKYC